MNKDFPRISHHKGAAMAKKLEDVLYAKSSTKYIFKNKHPKSYKHHEEQEFIEHLIYEKWNCGIAISNSDLVRITLQKFKEIVTG